MNLYINQGATMPYLELELVQDGYSDKLEFFDEIQNATVTLSMQEVNSCIKTIVCRPMEVIEDCSKCNNCFPEFRLLYKWRERDTRRKGKYEVTIEIDFLDGCGKLILPIHDKIYVNII